MIEADRDKLIKFLRMFSSHHDGEVAAAARFAHKIIKDRALDWGDLIIPVGRAHTDNGKWQRNTYSTPEYDETEAELIRKCSELNMCLTEWENEFISSIGESIIEWGSLTPKQRNVLDRIIDKLKLRGVWEDVGF